MGENNHRRKNKSGVIPMLGQAIMPEEDEELRAPSVNEFLPNLIEDPEALEQDASSPDENELVDEAEEMLIDVATLVEEDQPEIEVIYEGDGQGEPIAPQENLEEISFELIEDEEALPFIEADPESAELQAKVAQQEKSLEALQGEKKSLEEELKLAQARLLRTAADYENFKRRSLREREEQKKYGNERLLMDMIPVLDNLERALIHSANLMGQEGILDGIDMVQRQFKRVLKKYECEGFESKGTLFDPQKHEAVQQFERADLAPNTVVEEFHKGYFLRDRLIRPALVVVSKLPPGATFPPAATEEEAQTAQENDENQSQE